MTYYFVNTSENSVVAIHAPSHTDAWHIYIEHLKKHVPAPARFFFERPLNNIREDLEHNVFVTTEIKHIT